MFPLLQSSENGKIGMQIISSGPDSSLEQIKMNYIKMINKAKKNIYIETPYFVPDDAFLESLKIAAMSGVQIHIIIPGIYDKYYVYRAVSYTHLDVYKRQYQDRAWLEISLDVIAENYHMIKKEIGDKSEFMAVIKADAYGSVSYTHLDVYKRQLPTLPKEKRKTGAFFPKIRNFYFLSQSAIFSCPNW